MSWIIFLPAVVLAQESPAQLQVEIDGKTYVTSSGATLDVVVSGVPAQLRISELPWRHFDQAGVRFDYPRTFSWESDPSPPRNWTLDGNDAVVMLFDGAESAWTSTEGTLAGLEKAFGPGTRATRSKTVLKTRHRGDLAGTVSTIRLASSTISNAVFVLDTGAGGRLLVLQDSLADDGSHSAEYRAMYERLSADLEF